MKTVVVAFCSRFALRSAALKVLASRASRAPQARGYSMLVEGV